MIENMGMNNISRSKYWNNGMFTAWDLRCLAPFDRITYSIQNMASSIGFTKLSLKMRANSLARSAYDGCVSISSNLAENDSIVSSENGKIRALPLDTDFSAFLSWSPKIGMNSIGTPRAVPENVH